MKCFLGISNFLEEISSLSHSVVFLSFFALIAEEGFLSLLAILWNSAFRCLYLSFSPFLFASLLFTAFHSRAKANTVLSRECIGHSKHPLPTREDSTHGHHQMVNSEIRLIIFFSAKDGEALYSQQKQDPELTVSQIMDSLLPNSDLNWRK